MNKTKKYRTIKATPLVIHELDKNNFSFSFTKGWNINSIMTTMFGISESPKDTLPLKVNIEEIRKIGIENYNGRVRIYKTYFKLLDPVNAPFCWCLVGVKNIERRKNEK